jgi:UDP-N-acetylglucosamine:LPS N-acetylglucosamine transferase
MKKVLVVASAGGHLVQLYRMFPAYKEFKLRLITTKSIAHSRLFQGVDFRLVKDSNFDQKFKLLITFVQVFIHLLAFNPKVIVTTGAAPGLFAILIGRILGKKVIWIDSIANGDTLSFAGKVAKKITPYCYSQWEDVARMENVKYMGKVV